MKDLSELRSERCCDLSAELIQTLFRIVLNTAVDKRTALSLIDIGLPSEVLRSYEREAKKTRRRNALENRTCIVALALLKTESLEKLNKIRDKCTYQLSRNPFRYLYNKYIRSPLVYRRLRKSIISRAKELENEYLTKKEKAEREARRLHTEIDNFRTRTMLSFMKALNDEIYTYEEINPEKAVELSTFLIENLSSLQGIFLDRK